MVPVLAESFSCQNVSINQDNSKEAPWSCPSIADTPANDALNAQLTDVNLETGMYTCQYSYKDTHQVATSCTYSAETYKAELKDKLNLVRDNVVNAIVHDNVDIYNFNDDYHIITLGDYSEVSLSLHIQEKFKYDLNKIDDLHTKVNAHISGKLREFYKEATVADNYLVGLNLTNVDDPNQALAESYAAFVKPYVPSNPGTRKEETFSRFITGMVTLDKEVIKGYDGATGNLLDANWSKLSDKIREIRKNYVESENNNSNTVDPDSLASVQSGEDWLNIFRQKIWGFYYNLQRRLDLGYDIISSQLLFIMMAFFAISASARGAARYITNRESGQSSGEVKINEASIMKTLGILATVFVFYISVPYGIMSENIDAEETDLQHYEMRTNSSLAKGFVRYAMKEGAYFGTMIADLGTDAFLNFLVKKQGLNNGLKERNNIIESLRGMVYYFPALQLAYECRAQGNIVDDRFLASENTIGITKDYNKRDFFTSNNITEIGDGLCQKMLTRTINKLEEVSSDIDSLLAMIEKDMYVRMNATAALVRNHILLQKELGWMNIVAVPYTYFMMKNQELFFESSMNLEDIAEKARNFSSNIGLRSSEDALNDTMWAKDIVTTRENIKTAESNAKQHRLEITRLAVYNFLPGFTTIRNEILQRVQSLYSDILRLSRLGENKAEIKEHKAEYEAKFRDFLESMLRESKKYYNDNIKDLYPSEKLEAMIDFENPVELHKAFMVISYLVAMSIWKSGFIIIFLSAIAMIIGLKVVLYVIHVMIHFIISPFIVLWAFVTSVDGGMGKIKNYLRDTLLYMLYPTIIVIGVFVFIFSYELFYSIYGFITSVLIEGQLKAVELGIAASTANPATFNVTKGEMSFLAVYALRDITEILIDLLSVYVAFMTINKFPELVLKMMGMSDSAVIMLPQANEALQSKGGGSVNPLSK